MIAALKDQHDICVAERSPAAWAGIDSPYRGNCHYGDIADLEFVERCLAGADAVIHLVALVPDEASLIPYLTRHQNAFDVNLKGLWNVLETCRDRGIRRIVHIGSCVNHVPDRFLDAGFRRQEPGAYPLMKRLQEEICRFFFEAYRLPIVVLRAGGIADGPLGIKYDGKVFPRMPLPEIADWICRHDLADACRKALEMETETLRVLHTSSFVEAGITCNFAETCQCLDWRPGDALRRFLESKQPNASRQNPAQ